MTKIRKKGGRVVHTPLSYIFQMRELGGSAIQKYDSESETFNPDRTLTPFVLQPQLLVTDPEGTIPSGDYTSQMRNVSWTAVADTGGVKTNIPMTWDPSTFATTIRMNVATGTIVHVAFSADFTDTRRQEVQHFKWSEDLTTEAQATSNITLDHGGFTSKVNLVPWKRWGHFGIPVQLRNGNETVPDSEGTYRWFWWDEEEEEWSNDFTSRLWYVSGADTKQVIVDQDFIQDVLLKVEAYAYGKPGNKQSFTTRLRRWYGQYLEDINPVTGKYVFSDTETVALEAKVTNRFSGDIKDPAGYFDMEIFFAVGGGEMESVGYGPDVIIRRRDLQDGDPVYGVLVRELTCFIPITDDDGYALADDDGALLVAQFPTTEKEEEE